MNIQNVFGKHRVLLPVIHVRSVEHALLNARVAEANGADGVLLINQGASASVTIQAAHQVAFELPSLWVGINILGGDDDELLEYLQGTGIRGLWSDDAGITPSMPQEEAFERREEILGLVGSWSSRGGLYMSGVAFKYQTPVAEQHWGQVARLAVDAGIHVVMTSGPATGEAADPRKLVIMREALGDHALGVCSGISEKNVESFLETTNAFVVASSLLRPGHEDNFDPDKIRRLSDRIPRSC